MKNNFFLRAALLLAGFGLAFASCSDTDTDPAGTPAFPEPFETTIAPGARYSFDIAPNMDWEATIPDEVAAYFWFDDDGHTVYSLHGTAGKATIVVVCSELTDFDEDRVCPVSLTMAGQTRVIAKLTIASLERALSVYTAVLSPDPDESGDLFLQDEETGAYTYETASAEAFAMLTKRTECNYMQRIRIESNFDWSIGHYPEWMIPNATTGSAGKTDLFLLTDAEKYPWENTSESLVFIDASDTEHPVEVATVTVDMPGCGDRIFTSFASEEQFNAAGAYYIASQGNYSTPELGTTKNIEAAYGSRIVLLVENADGSLSVGDDASWIRFDNTIEWSEAAKSAGFWSHNLRILCAANTGNARKAYVVAIPRTKVPEGFAAASLIDGSKVADAYADFVVSTITQNSAAAEYIKVETFEGSDEYFSFSKIPAGNWPYEDAWSNAPVAYNLTYKTPFAYQPAVLEFSEPYASVEFYNEEGPYAQSQISPLWLELEESEYEPGKEWIKLKGTYDFEHESFTWAEGVQPEFPMAYIVFKNEAGAILGIIEFMFDGEAGSGGNDGEVALVGNQPSIELTTLTAQDDEFDPSIDCPQYKITYTDKSVFTANLTLPEYDDMEVTGTEAYVFHMGSYDSAILYFENEGDSAEVLLKKEDGTVICRLVLVFHEGEGGGSGSTGVSLAGPTPGVTLVELKAGDADYDSGMDWPQYKITSADPEALGSLTLNLPAYDDTDITVSSQDTEAAIYAMGGTYMVCFYAGAVGDKADITLIKDEMPICRLLIEFIAE